MYFDDGFCDNIGGLNLLFFLMEFPSLCNYDHDPKFDMDGSFSETCPNAYGKSQMNPLSCLACLWFGGFM